MKIARKRRTLALAIAVVAMLVLGSFTAYQLWPHESSAMIGAQGGEVWSDDHSVGVAVAPGGVSQDTTVAFKPSSVQAKEAPIMAAMKVIVPPVDIVPDHPLNVAGTEAALAAVDKNAPSSKVQVKLKAPKDVPLSRTDASGKPQLSIYNAGIEVFNTNYQAWVPLETTVQGDTLVADAPHFSEYRAVEVLPGTHTVNVSHAQAVQVTTDAATDSPLHLLAHAVGEWLRAFALNAMGSFAPEKMEACEKEPSKEYEVEVTAKTPGKAGACMIEQNGNSQLLIKNGWSFPMMYTTDASAGVTAMTYPTELDLPSAARNKLIELFGRNVALASGLDVAKFQLGETAPAEFKVTGQFSATGFVVDVATALFSVFMPEGYVVAAQIGGMVDLYNCLYVSVVKVANLSLGDIPARIGEIAKACITPALAEKFAGIELLKAFAKETRILPEFVDAATAGVYGAITGGDSLTKVVISVSKPSEQLKWLRGSWVDGGGGAGTDKKIVIKDDFTGTWNEINYTSQDTTASSSATFHVAMSSGRPTLFVDRSNVPALPKGGKFPIHKRSNSDIILGDQGNFELIRG